LGNSTTYHLVASASFDTPEEFLPPDPPSGTTTTSFRQDAFEIAGIFAQSRTITHTESSESLREETSLNSNESLRPATPDGGGSTSPPSSPTCVRTGSLVPSNEDLPPQLSVDNGSGFRLSKRASEWASAALAQVVKEFEEEAEDEIVMPRTAHPVTRPSDSDHSRVVNDTKEPPEPGASLTHHRSSSDSTWKVDSFLKECPRIEGMNIVTLSRKALKDYTFSDGTFIPKGTLIAAPALSPHQIRIFTKIPMYLIACIVGLFTSP